MGWDGQIDDVKRESRGEEKRADRQTDTTSSMHLLFIMTTSL
jgi:hypothetical protein